MKRLCLIFALLLTVVSCYGQKRVYLNKGDVSEDIFVVNVGTEESPRLEVSYQMHLISDSDTTFVVIKEEDLEDAAAYFQAVLDTYEEYRSAAKRGRIENEVRPIELYPPAMRIRWTRHPMSDRWSEWRQIRTYQTAITHDFPIAFNVTSGFAHVVGRFQVYDENESEEMGFIRFMLDRKSLETILKWMDPGTVRKEYSRRKR